MNEITIDRLYAGALDRVTAERDAALVEVERLKNMDHRQILAESAAKYLLDSGAENFVGEVFTVEADDGQAKFEVIVTTQKVGAKSPGEVCNEMQKRVDVLEGLLRDAKIVLGEFAGTSSIARKAFRDIESELKPAEGGGDHPAAAKPFKLPERKSAVDTFSTYGLGECAGWNKCLDALGDAFGGE